MAASRVRADYDQLKTVAGRFGSQAQAARQTLQALRRQLDVLQGGDWIGQGANAFYQEMDGRVLPTLTRLSAALETAQQTTLQISQIMGQAEGGAADVLRRFGPTPAVVAGPGGAAPAPAVAGPSGPSGATTPQDIGTALRQVVDLNRAAFGDEVAASTAAGAMAGSAGAPPAVQAAVYEALEKGAPAATKAAVEKAVNDTPGLRAGITRGQEDAAIDKNLAQFNPGVRDIVKKSPTLRAEILKADQEHFTFTSGGGSMANTRNHVVNIHVGNTDAQTVQELSHEMGHATDNRPDVLLPQAGQDRADFVGKNLQNALLSEGGAQMNNAKVRDELLAAGGPDIGIGGQVHAGEYQQTWDDLKAGKITQDQALTHMSVMMGDEPSSQPPYPPHRDYYLQMYQDYWDTKVEPFLPHH